jgi:hypothetical protein
MTGVPDADSFESMGEGSTTALQVPYAAVIRTHLY